MTRELMAAGATELDEEALLSVEGGTDPGDPPPPVDPDGWWRWLNGAWVWITQTPDFRDANLV